ncbi:PrsW family intramembrane metalloprotease [Streptomyces sp. NPDC002176]|uniref:PrsW family intramembrane metalloprotease n=1 Tax=Streptomyces sp. NPDC002176 TaxID=3364634 RepID=UPI00384E4EDC
MAISSAYPPHPSGDGPRPPWWRRQWVRHGSLIALLALSGLVILALVRRQTGTEGFLVGLGLAVVPVPWLIAAFRWLDRVRPGPWRNLLFAFAWGACAAALIAIVANSFATHWIATTTANPSSADTLGATVIAPVVEESAKAAAVLLVFVFRRRDFTGPVGGAALAGVTATGFAFTENILYLGNAFGTDRSIGTSGLVSVTAATFFVRAVMSPFAHPLFTVCTGIGFGLAALPGRRRRPVLRVLFPVGGLLLAMGLHALWNGSAAFGQFGFLVVYGGFMAPAFGLLAWLLIRSRQRELRVAREELPVYVYAGWLGPAEPFALGSLRARRLARDHARRCFGGRPAARAVVRYESDATELALLRHRARAGRVGTEFAARERELLAALWQHRDSSRPALEYAAHVTAPPPAPVPYWQRYGHPAPPYAGYNPYRT